MNKAGGILGIVGGVFGFFAAIVTLFMGGLGSAFHASSSSSVIGLGWGGILFSFLSIIFGAVAFSKPKGAGIGLIVSSIAGVILGGTLVAICMALSLIGGILSVIGAKGSKAAAKVQTDETPAAASEGKKKGLKTFGMVAGGIALLLLGLATISSTHHPVSNNEDPLEALANGTPASIQPSGQLAAMFQLGSDNTDLQRENALNEIKGKIVAWRLPVYEVSRNGDGYKIQTEGHNYVGTFIYLTPRNDEERRYIESLTTGQVIAFRGIVKDSFMRSLAIDPAILESANRPAAGASSQQVSKEGADLLAEEHRLNELCRDGSGDDPKTQSACDERDKVDNQLRAHGWCWEGGANGIIGEWEKCESNSGGGQP